MALGLSEIKNPPKISEMVIESILAGIEEGNIKSGDDLPSERELSETFKISRGALREGLSILEYLGILENEGNRKVVSEGANTIQKALQIVKISNQDNAIYDFIEGRKALESTIVRLACERATESDLARIEDAVKRLEEDNADVEADYDFHINLAKSSHNVFLAAIEELVVVMLASVREKSVSNLERKEKIPKEHAAIFNAVKDRNSDLAVVLIEEHLDNMKINIEDIDNKNCL